MCLRALCSCDSGLSSSFYCDYRFFHHNLTLRKTRISMRKNRGPPWFVGRADRPHARSYLDPSLGQRSCLCFGFRCNTEKTLTHDSAATCVAASTRTEDPVGNRPLAQSSPRSLPHRPKTHPSHCPPDHAPASFPLSPNADELMFACCDPTRFAPVMVSRRVQFSRPSRGAGPVAARNCSHCFADRHSTNFAAKNSARAAKNFIDRFDLPRAVLLSMSSSSMSVTHTTFLKGGFQLSSLG